MWSILSSTCSCWYRDAILFTRRIWFTQVCKDWIIAWFLTNGLNLHGCIWTFPNKTSGSYTLAGQWTPGNPWNKLGNFKEIIWSQKWARPIWHHKTYNLVFIPSAAISGSFSWSSWKSSHFHVLGTTVRTKLILKSRVDSASCWYNWLFHEGFLRKEKLPMANFVEFDL